ncbi:probable glycosyltransferase STELLO1 isoform X2 [Haliotis rubra]|nr:probable glycosyltransferase STELLO1 isoform X2 [Haliotis rubra]
MSTLERKLLWLIMLGVCSTSVMLWMNHRHRSPVTTDASFLSRHHTRGHRNSGNRWMVVSLDSVYQNDVSYLDDVIDWNIVISGAQPYLDGCRKPRCTYLHPKNIKDLRLYSVRHIQENGYPLKNIAYLYAMSKSAEVIYDLEYGVKPTVPMHNFIYSDHTHGLIYAGNTIFNHYKHFGQPYLSPVAFPTSIKEMQSRYYQLCYVPTPPIQQGITTGETPLYHDQRQKVLRISRGKTLDLQFDTMAPPAFVPRGRFSVVTSGNTLFTRDAFWVMLLPSSGDSVLDGVIRGYISQRLLWETNGSVGHMGVTAHRNHNPHINFKDNDILVSNKADLLVNALETWTCDHSNSLHECLRNLVRHVVSKDILAEENVASLESWIQDLDNMNVLPDSKRIYSNKQYSRDQNCTKIHFTPSQHNHKIYNLTSMSVVAKLPWDNMPICPEADEVKEALRSRSPAKYLFTDVLLIVEINYPQLYSATRTVEPLYRRYFPNILFCGPSMESFHEHSSDEWSHVEGITEGWHYMYDCIAFAMKMNYRAKGFLHIGDDTFLQIWNLHKLPRDHVWFNNHLQAFNRSVLNSPWRWWKEMEGRRNYEQVLQELKEISQRGAEGADLANRFFTMYVQNRKTLDMMFGSTCDFYYVPNRLKDMFVFLISLLKKYKVIIEVGVATVLQGMDRRENIEYVPGKLIFGDDRNRVQELFISDDYFFHPMKFGRWLKTDDGRTFFCEKLLPLMEGSVQFSKD